MAYYTCRLCGGTGQMRGIGGMEANCVSCNASGYISSDSLKKTLSETAPKKAAKSKKSKE